MSTGRPVGDLGRLDAWDGVRAVVAGFGPSGFAAADNLTHLGAGVTALDESAGDQDRQERAELLEVLGATVRLGEGATAVLPDDVDVLVTSPGWSPTAPLLAQAAARGIPVWSEVELAWRLRHPEHTTPWLVVTGARSPAPALRMLEAVLRAAGLRAQHVGGGAMPALEAVMDPTPHDVLAVAVSDDELRDSLSMSALGAAVLDTSPDQPHAGRVYERVQQACVYPVSDPRVEQLVVDADVVEGARAIGITLGMPGIGTLGVVEDILVDRAFIAERASSAAELCMLGDLVPDGADVPDPQVVVDALVAAALARAHGVTQAAVRDGLRAARP